MSHGWSGDDINTLATTTYWVDGANLGLNTDSGDATISTAIGGTDFNVVKMGANKLTLTANNNYLGSSYGHTQILAGTLQLGNGGTTGSVAGQIDIAGSNSQLIFNR